MRLGEAVAPPPGYLSFCIRNPESCFVEAAPGAERRASEAAGLRGSVAIATPPLGASDSQTSSTVAHKGAGLRGAFGLAGDRAAPAARTIDLSALENARTASTGDRPNPPHLDAATWKRVDQINRRVNRAIIRKTDEAQFGRGEYWTLPDLARKAYGDCEEYVLAKREALIQAGLPASALSIAVVVTPWQETHAVLVLASSQGEYVLDNLNAWITPWRSAGYRWKERQAAGQSMKWVKVAEADPANADR